MATPTHPLTGKRFRVRGRTQHELAAYLHRIESLRNDLALGMTAPADVDRALRRLRVGSVTLERAARAYAARPDLAPNTRRRVLSAIAGPLAELAGEELDALDGPRLAPVFDRLARKLARGSLSAVWRTLRAVVRHAAERGWTARVPWGAWRPRARAGQQGRAPRECARTREELGRLLAAARELDDAQGAPYRALEAKLACACLLGLRQGELAGLRWYDVYWGRGVGVRRQWTGRPLKTGDSAEIEAPRALFEVLERHGRRRGSPELGAPVFPAPAGGHYAGGECLSTLDLRRCVALALLNRPSSWSPHSCRDTFATLEAAKHGGDLARIAQRTRHRSIGSLVRYLRAFERSPDGPAQLPP